MPWIDPHETDAAAWTGGSEGRERELRTVCERAIQTPVPYQRSYHVHLHGAAVSTEFNSRAYDNAHLECTIAVEDSTRVKLLTKGHLWGDGEEHQRFRAQYRREPDPTDTVPFGEYSTWVRYQFGTVSRGDDGAVHFEIDPRGTHEETRVLAWENLFEIDQLRLAEGELVRNPPFARYVLRERDDWDAVRDALRYDPDAFAVGP